MDRREFLKSIGVTATTLSITQGYNPLVIRAFAEVIKTAPPVIWFAGSTCGGCSISALNAVHPKIDEILMELITLHYHINLSASSGDKMMENIFSTMEDRRDEYIYIQEGSIPTAYDGKFCIVGEYNGKKITMLDMARRLAKNAKAVVAVGSCSSFGGVPSISPNPTDIKPLSELIKKPVINIPGCPAHPDDIFGTLLYYLKNGMPELDKYNRPKLFFSTNVHKACFLKPHFDREEFATNWGEKDKCYAMLGCEGPKSMCDAPNRGWNNNTNWCIKAGSHCIGCTEPTFGKKRSGLYF